MGRGNRVGGVGKASEKVVGAVRWDRATLCKCEVSSANTLPLSPSLLVPGMANSSPLWVAARNGHGDVVRCLLSKGAAVNVPRGPDNSTPLWIACACGHAHVARDLLGAGADASVPSQQVR